MRAFFTATFTICLAFLLFPGCSRKPEDATKAAAPRKPSVANTVAEEITGYRAVKQGQQAKEQLRGIQKEHNEDMSAILEEN